MVKYLVWLILLVSLSSNLPAQKYFDLGFTGGASYYLGEINPSRQFYKPSPAFGAFGRYNLNNRQAFRLSFNYISIKASDADFDNVYQQLRNASFSASFIEVASTFEFNFLPYITNKKQKGFSPYLYGGLGYTFLLNGPDNKGSHINVPFGFGIKYSLSKKVGVGLEWGMRKTFNDYTDNITNPGGEAMKSSFNNNDWYSFAGFFISFRLNDKSGDCPVYW
jgi:hypothetical protein